MVKLGTLVLPWFLDRKHMSIPHSIQCWLIIRGLYYAEIFSIYTFFMHRFCMQRCWILRNFFLNCDGCCVFLFHFAAVFCWYLPIYIYQAVTVFWHGSHLSLLRYCSIWALITFLNTLQLCWLRLWAYNSLLLVVSLIFLYSSY